MNFNLLFTRTEVSNDNKWTESKPYKIKPNSKYEAKKGSPRKTKEKTKKNISKQNVVNLPDSTFCWSV